MSDVLDIYLAEYKQLKDEQRARIIARDYLLYVMLTVVATVMFFAFRQSPVQYLSLLLLPPAGFVLGWTYLINDWKVSELGTYFRDDLTALMTNHVTDKTDIPLYWETLHRQCVHRGRRKTIQMIVNLSTFCVPSLAALAMFVTLSASWSMLFVIVLIEFLAIFSLAVEFIRSTSNKVN